MKSLEEMYNGKGIDAGEFANCVWVHVCILVFIFLMYRDGLTFSSLATRLSPKALNWF
jgi:hypothetical protein